MIERVDAAPTDPAPDGLPTEAAPLDPAIERFVERMGLVAQSDHLPRIAGRIFGLLMVEDEPIAFGAIAARLKISRASVSNNTRLLEDLGVIERLTKPGERQDHFRIAPEPYARLLRGSVRRARKAQAVVEEAQAELPAERPAARARLDALARFYQAVGDGMEALIDRL